MKRQSRVPLLQLAVAALSVVLLQRLWTTPYDFVRAIDHGDVLFGDFVFHYYPTVANNLREGPPAGGFFYPAGFAALMAPLGLFPLETAMMMWAFVLLACVVFVASRLVREAARENASLAAFGTLLTMTSVPVLHDLKWGQVSLPILACAGGAMLLNARGRSWAAAALLGICVGIKGYPLVLLGWFLLKGDLHFFVRGAIASVVTLVVLPAIVLGPAHALFFQRVSQSAVLGASDGVLRDFNSQYGPVVIARAVYGLGAWDLVTVAQEGWGIIACLTCLLAIGWLALIAARSSAPAIAERRDVFGLVLIFSSVPFWLKTSWTHYFVHLPVAQTLLVGTLASAGSARRGTRVLALVLLLCPSVFLSNLAGLLSYANREGWLFYASDGSLFFANLFVLFGCAIVLVDAHIREGASLLPNWSLEGGDRTNRAA